MASRFANISLSIFHGSILLALFMTSSTLSAQPDNWNVHYYSTEDGLSSNNINCIIKDRTGIIWVGADNGLNYFDGYSFSQLENVPGNLHALSTVKVLSIYEDESGLLWIGTSDGLFRFDPSKSLNQIKQFCYRKPGIDSSLPQPQPVNRICEDKNGLLWMNCADVDEGIYPGLLTFNKNTELFTKKTINGTIQNENGEFLTEEIVPDIYCDSEGTLWASTYSGLHRYNYATDSFESFVPYPEEQKSVKNFLLYLSEDSFGNFWAAGVFGIYPFNREKEQFEEPQALFTEGGMLSRESVVFSTVDDQNGHLWMRVNQSLIKAEPIPEELNKLHIDKEWIPDISNVSTINQLTALYVENPWSIWLPVGDKGLCHIRLQRNNFMVLQPSSMSGESSGQTNYVTSLYVDSLSNMWFSTIEPGAIKYKLSDGTSESYHMTSYDYIHGIDKDAEGNMWFASRYGIHTKASVKQNGALDKTSYFPDKNQPSSLTARHEIDAHGVGKVSQYLYEHLIFKDSNGRMWFNSGKGIHDRYDPAIDGFLHIDHRRIDRYNNDTCLLERENELWLPSRYGLIRIIPPFSKISDHTYEPELTILYTNISGDQAALNTDWIKTIYVSKNYEPGTIWIGTIGGGLNKLIRNKADDSVSDKISFENYTEADGLCDNNVLGILEDMKGNLWLSTLNGLSRFDPKTGRCINFYKKDGLPANQFTWAEPCIGPGGKMFFPNSKGIVIFDPENLQSNNYVPPVVITEFRIFNQPVIPGPGSPIENNIRYVEKVELAHNQNFISFAFAALNYESPGQNQYRYRMEGLDREWVHAGTRRFAEYTDLKQGNYTFTVCASNNNGVWNEKGRSLHISINRPPWYTWWAFTLYGLILAGLIFWFRIIILNRVRTRRALEFERIEKDKILEIDRLKSRFFTNISHEFRTPLSLITGPLETALRSQAKTIRMDRNEIEMLDRNAKRLQALINQLLDISKLEFGTEHLKVEEDNLEEFIRAIYSNFLSLAESKRIQYNFNVQGIRQAAWFDRDKIEKIMVNLIDNAFKFTPSGGAIRVTLNYETDPETDHLKNAVLSVSDTGIGIPADRIDRIFDRFYQVDNSDTRNEEGSGIGLALVKEIVDLYHGTISVESDLKKGTTFIVKLPVSKKFFRDEETESAIADDHAAASKRIVVEQESAKPLLLIIEDNKDLRNYISSYLDKEFQVITAVNGRNGLDVANERIPDLVISDLMMPEMDGIEVCKRLRDSDRTSHIPIILLTAKADQGSKIEGLETGADDYIIKPFNMQELHVRVNNLIEQRKRLREQFKRQFVNEPGIIVPLSSDDSLLKKILETIDQHISDSEFNMQQMAQELNMSKRQLFRKVSAVTGYSPNELLNSTRLRKAAAYFDKGEKNISRVMYEVGYMNQSYFSKCFRDLYSLNPSEYIKQKS